MKKYGLIGANLKYSYSKLIHDYLIYHYKIDACYELIERSDVDKKFLLNYQGLNITIPFKKDVIPLLDTFQAKFESCNTIKNADNLLIGYNTDIVGFDYLIKHLNLKTINKVVILGNSASSQMLKAYFKKQEVIIISRRDAYYNYQLLPEITADLLINTTPVGMNEWQMPIDKSLLLNYQAVIDLNYNPINSLLAQECQRLHIPFINGLLMLIKQACASFEIWHDLKVNDEVIQRILLEIYRREFKKIAIIGMPLTGKSNIIKYYQGIDLDQEIIIKHGTSIEELMAQGNFREYEYQRLKELVAENHEIIALGGGAVLDYRNIELLNEYLIIYYQEDLDVLISRFHQQSANTRPLLKSEEDLIRIFQEREELYKMYSNITLRKPDLIKLLDSFYKM